eukprot:6990936-Pyramimonas_sp.AAC.1
MPATSWAWRATFWRDTQGKWPPRRRRMKWENTLRHHAAQAGVRQWARAAGNRTEWALQAEFLARCNEG